MKPEIKSSSMPMSPIREKVTKTGASPVRVVFPVPSAHDHNELNRTKRMSNMESMNT